MKDFLEGRWMTQIQQERILGLQDAGLGYKKIAIAGGVAANTRIRADFKKAAEKDGCTLYVPPLSLCGDNGAMIGSQAYYEYLAGNVAGSDLNAYANMEL